MLVELHVVDLGIVADLDLVLGPGLTNMYVAISAVGWIIYARIARAEIRGQRRLDYVPGEVLVKFQPGVSLGGQQRALMALRSRPRSGRRPIVRPMTVATSSGSATLKSE